MNFKKHFQTGSIQLFFLIVAIVLSSLKSGAQTPYAAIGEFPSGTKISKSVFNTLPNIGVYVKATVFEIKYQVIGYTLKLVDDEGSVREIVCQGSAFSTAAKQAIDKYARSGDIITIQNIRAKGEDGKEVKVPSLVYPIE